MKKMKRVCSVIVFTFVLLVSVKIGWAATDEIKKVEWDTDYTVQGKPVFIGGMDSIKAKITYKDGTEETVVYNENGNYDPTSHGDSIYLSCIQERKDSLYCMGSRSESYIEINGKEYCTTEIIVWDIGEDAAVFRAKGDSVQVVQEAGKTKRAIILCEKTGKYALRYENPDNKKEVTLKGYEEDYSFVDAYDIYPFKGYTGEREDRFNYREANIALELKAGTTYVVTMKNTTKGTMNYQLSLLGIPSVTKITVNNAESDVEAGGDNWWGVNGWPLDVTYSDGSEQHLWGPRDTYKEFDEDDPYRPYDDYGKAFYIKLKDSKQKKAFHNQKLGTYPVTIKVSGKTFEGKLKIKRSVSKAEIKLAYNSCYYNGKYRKPAVKSVKVGDKVLQENKDYQVEYSRNKNTGIATVCIIGKGINYAGMTYKDFKILPAKTSLKTLSAKSKGFTVKWEKQDVQSTGYQLQYSTSKSFSNSKIVTVAKKSTVSKTIGKLKAKKRYYVRIRTYKQIKHPDTGKAMKIVSGWSEAKSVVTK